MDIGQIYAILVRISFILRIIISFNEPGTSSSVHLVLLRLSRNKFQQEGRTGKRFLPDGQNSRPVFHSLHRLSGFCNYHSDTGYYQRRKSNRMAIVLFLLKPGLSRSVPHFAPIRYYSPLSGCDYGNRHWIWLYSSSPGLLPTGSRQVPRYASSRITRLLFQIQLYRSG